jgi:phosphate starvation-inducible protein PhoH and related proteins
MKCVAMSMNKPVYTKVLNDKTIPLVICTGPAGTGKTMEACKSGMYHLKAKHFEKLLVTRPSVSVDESLGYLPGSIDNKMNPWMIPIYDYMEEFCNRAELGKYMKEEVIEIAPLGFIRGRTFHNTIVIADEMQNATHNQMMNLLTRIGENSKIIITGDLNQCDLPNITNGLEQFLHYLQKYEGDCTSTIEHIQLDNDDIMRSEFTKLIINIYDQ